MISIAEAENSLYAQKPFLAGNVTDFPRVTNAPASSARSVQSKLVIEASSDHSLSVERTAVKHGLSRPELERIAEAAKHLRSGARRRGRQVYAISVAPGTPDTTRRYFEQRLTTIQGQAGLPKLWYRVTETSPHLHFHYCALVNEKVIKRLEGSAKFNAATADGIGRVFHFKQITNDAGWRYLTKEATPQAAFHNPIVWQKRPKGSHRLPGDDVADRVAVSADLAKLLPAWKRTYGQETNKRDYPLRRLHPKKAPRFTDQVVLPFIEPQVRRPVARLHDFGGGWIPPAVADEIEFKRHQKGWSQRDLALRCGIKQPQLANALRGHDPLSAWVTSRLHEILLSREAA